MFICGFDTHPIDTGNIDRYVHFELFFAQTRMTGKRIEFFRYTTAENLDDVYDRLSRILNSKKRKRPYTVLMAHSMGAGLLVKYMADVKSDTQKFNNRLHKYKKILLLMPFISKQDDMTVTFIRVCPFAEKITLPWIEKVPIRDFPQKVPQAQHYSIPPETLLLWKEYVSNHDICHHVRCRFIPLMQVVQMYRHYFLTETKLVETLNSTPNCMLFYATDEEMTRITPDLLARINNTRIVTGKHFCFNNICNVSAFFESLCVELKK